MTSKTIGLIGLGLVGSALLERFQAAGFHVVGYDIDADKMQASQSDQFTPCDSPASVADQASRIVLSLPNSNTVNTVVEGQNSILQSTQPITHIVDTTTADPVQTVELSNRLKTRNIPFIDATILGSSQQVRDADVLLMVGGEKEHVDACTDIFNTFAAQVFHLGPTGKGAEAKLIVNLILGLNRLVLAEGLVLGQKAGFDLNILLDVLKSGAAYSRVMDTKGDKMIQSEFTPQGRLAQHLKDIDLILNFGAQTSTPLPLSALHAQLMRSGIALDLGDQDNSAIIQVLRQMAGIKK